MSRAIDRLKQKIARRRATEALVGTDTTYRPYWPEWDGMLEWQIGDRAYYNGRLYEATAYIAPLLCLGSRGAR